MLEATPDSSKPSDFPVLLPINIPGQRAEQKEPSTTGNKGNVYLILSIGGLSLSALGVCYQREVIMAFL